MKALNRNRANLLLLFLRNSFAETTAEELEHRGTNCSLFSKKVKEHVTSMKWRVVIDVLFRALLCLVCIEVFELVALIETEDTLPIIGIDYKKAASCLVVIRYFGHLMTMLRERSIILRMDSFNSFGTVGCTSCRSLASASALKRSAATPVSTGMDLIAMAIIS